MAVPAIKMSRVYYTLLADKSFQAPFFPEACMRGALGYLLMDWIGECRSVRSAKFEQVVRLYEALIGAVPWRKQTVATPPKMAMLLIRSIDSKKHEYHLELTLFGENLDLIQVFQDALVQLGREGVGNSSVKFDVSPDVRMKFGSLADIVLIESSCSLDVQIDFFTPTTLKAYGGEFLQHWDSDAFARNLYNRISLLSDALGVDYNPLYSLEEFVTMFKKIPYKDDSERIFRKRYSSRQRISIDYSGFVGHVILKSVSCEILPYLMCGELLGVGKNTSFGGGRYSLLII